uniref:Ras family protein n=1 Tax=Arcella intermedia TaxID=1963864 RepID=A0A6B2LLV3_9EUKA
MILKFVGSTSKEYKTHTTTIHLGTTSVKLIIKDMGDEEVRVHFRSLFYAGTNGVIAMYDITNRESYTNVVRLIKEIILHFEENVKIVLVGGKCDLEKERKVSTEEARKYAEEGGIEFFETSAEDGCNVKEVFSALAQTLVKKKQKEEDENE